MTKNDPRKDQLLWLETVLESTGLAPTALAIKCGLAVTTITRFKNDKDHLTALSAKTIASIENATNIRYGHDVTQIRQQNRAEAVEFKDIPENAVGKAINSMILESNCIKPWQIQTNSLEYASIKPQDIMLVDNSVSPLSGDIVLVSIQNYDFKKLDYIFRILETPYLIACSNNPLYRKPEYLDKQKINIVGTVIATMRLQK